MNDGKNSTSTVGHIESAYENLPGFTKVLVNVMILAGGVGILYWMGLFSWKAMGFACACFVVLALMIAAACRVEQDTRDKCWDYCQGLYKFVEDLIYAKILNMQEERAKQMNEEQKVG